jgi:hypothetical protein
LRWGDEDKGTRRDGDKGIDEIEGIEGTSLEEKINTSKRI